MEISDFYNGQAWGILPEKLDGMAQYFHDNQQLIQEQAAEFEAAVRGGRKEDAPNYSVSDDGVAIIPVVGPITKRASFWSFIFSGVSVAGLTRDFDAALQDHSINAIVFDIDSPGGTIGGLESLASLIFESRSVKPSVAFANGLMASAAYWIGSSAGAIVSEKTASVGSIGVMTVHYDYSKAEEKYGLKRTYLAAGKYKVLGNESEPLSSFAKEYFQDRLDYFYSMFVDAVARNRDTDPQTVLKDMADGKVFIGAQALEAGLIDHVGGLEDAVELAAAMADRKKSQFTITSNLGGKNKMKFKTVEELVAALPDLCKEIFDQGVASVKIDDAVAAATLAEGERIVGLAAIQFGEKKGEQFKAIVASGMTAEQLKIVAPEAGGDDNAEEKDLKAELLEALKGSGAATPGRDSTAATENSKDYLTLVDEYRLAQKCTRVEAMQAVMKTHPQAHEKYLESVN